ncbi:MAG: sugar phosphate isomerase/epimerase family protein [Thermoguttaceae bacterium]
MPFQRMTRREAMRAGAAALPMMAALATGVECEAQQANGPTIGISTLGFADYTNRQLAEELAREGIRVVQLFLNQTDSRFWKYNGRSDVSDMTASRCEAIGQAYRSAGVAIHSIGVYTNLIHPDAEERKANLAYFDAMMRIGANMGVHAFVTEAGHYHTNAPEPAVPLHFQESTWKQMVDTGKQLADLADRYKATILFEPFYRGFLATAKRMRLFLEDIGSPRVRALLDPANLLESNDLEEMFAQLGPWIDCLHAKDRKLHVDRGVPAGQGDRDERQYVTLAAQRTPKAPLILEYVGPKDYQQALQHLRKALGG